MEENGLHSSRVSLIRCFREINKRSKQMEIIRIERSNLSVMW